VRWREPAVRRGADRLPLRIAGMHSKKRRKWAALLLVHAAHGGAADAAEDWFALGAVYGAGNKVNIYGVEAAWVPQKANELLAPHDLDLRVTGQIARWVTTVDASPHHSLIDGSVMGELRYSPWREGPVQPFVGAGFGFHLLSNVRIEYRDLTTAFNFGSQGAIGVTFGEQARYEIAALIEHVSNAGIKQPNYGLTYSGIRVRIALP
jgi:lipid A 3-O-deacylase